MERRRKAIAWEEERQRKAIALEEERQRKAIAFEEDLYRQKLAQLATPQGEGRRPTADEDDEGLLLFNPPAAFHAWVDSQAHLKLSRDALYFLWNGLSPDTRAGYGSAVKSYEFFCSQTGLRPWPASVQPLAEWVTGRATGRPLMQYQAKVKPETIASMLSALRSVHVDRQYSLTPFESPWLKRLLDGIKRCQPDAEVHKAEPISRQTLVKLAKTDTGSIADLNFITACKVAWAGFLRCGEFTYSAKDYPGSKLTRSDVTFDEAFSYAIIRLKRSKTDYDHKGVEIVLAASRDQVCPWPVSALRDLFPQLPSFGPGQSPLLTAAT